MLFRSRAAGDIVREEVPLSGIAVPASSSSFRNLRFDFTLTSCALQSNISADVTVSNPISSSHAVLTQNAARNGASNQRAESRKLATYAGVSASLGFTFIPLALEVFGRFGKQTDNFLKQLASRAIANSAEVDQTVANKLHASLIHLWKTKISCLLQKGNVRIIHMYSYRAVQGCQNPLNSSAHRLDFGFLQQRLFQ